MRVLEASAVSITASANGIAQSQTPAGAGDLTLNGSGVATYPYALQSNGSLVGGSQHDVAGAAQTSTRSEARLNPPRAVTITTGADESAKTFTIYGTDRAGMPIQENMTGPSTATGTTTKLFASVNRIAVTAATTAAVTAGWGATSYSRWIFVGNKEHTGVRAILASGTATYDVERTTFPFNERALHGVGSTSAAPEYTGGDQADDVEVIASGKTASFTLAAADTEDPFVAYRVKMTTSTGTVKLRITKTHATDTE